MILQVMSEFGSLATSQILCNQNLAYYGPKLCIRSTLKWYLRFMHQNISDEMGAFASRSLRPFRNFNIESRAQKEISKDKPTPAPKHKSNVIDYERALQGKTRSCCYYIVSSKANCILAGHNPSPCSYCLDIHFLTSHSTLFVFEHRILQQ